MRREHHGWTLSLTANTMSGFQDLYFERWDCKAKRGDVYAARSVDDPALVRARVLGPPASGRYANPVARQLATVGAGGS